MKTAIIQARHRIQSEGKWIEVPPDMKKHYERLGGWEIRELVDLKDAEQAMVVMASGISAVLEDA